MHYLPLFRHSGLTTLLLATSVMAADGADQTWDEVLKTSNVTAALQRSSIKTQDGVVFGRIRVAYATVIKAPAGFEYDTSEFEFAVECGAGKVGFVSQSYFRGGKLYVQYLPGALKWQERMTTPDSSSANGKIAAEICKRATPAANIPSTGSPEQVEKEVEGTIAAVFSVSNSLSPDYPKYARSALRLKEVPETLFLAEVDGLAARLGGSQSAAFSMMPGLVSTETVGMKIRIAYVATADSKCPEKNCFRILRLSK